MLLSDNRDHYTGMISLRKIESNIIDTMNDEKWLIDKWGYSAYNIVDGQQRLTTFIILINEIVNLFISQNKDKPINQIYINSIPATKIIEDYLVIVKPDSDNQIRTYKFGYRN